MSKVQKSTSSVHKFLQSKQPHMPHNVIDRMRASLQDHRKQLKAVEQDAEFDIRRLITEPLHPETWSRIAWDLLMLLLIMVCAIMVPLDLGLGGLEGESNDIFGHVILVAFSIDILLNFRTAYYDKEGCLEQRSMKIVIRYLKGWFPLDFFSTFPFELALANMGQMRGSVLARLPRVIKMFRLMRLMRLAKVQAVIEEMFGLSLLTNLYVMVCVKFATLFVTLLLISHWLACGFCALGGLEESQAIEDELYEGAVKVGWTYDGINALDLSAPQRYRAAFYFSFCTLLMGKPLDISFQTSYCRYFFMIFGFIKPLVAATIMGVMTNMVVKQNTKKGQLQRKKATLGIFMQQKKVAKPTVHQVFAYLEHADQQMESVQELEAIKGLSPTLRDEISYQTIRSRIQTLTIFENVFGLAFIRHLCTVVTQQHFGPDDMVFQEGHYMPHMVFVDSGTLKLFRLNKDLGKSEKSDKSDKDIIDAGEVDEDSCYGAECLFCEGACSKFTVMCLSFCELTFLSVGDFKSVISQNPVWASNLRVVQECLREHPHHAESLAQGDCAALEAALPEHNSQHVRNRWNSAVKHLNVFKLCNMKVGDEDQRDGISKQAEGLYSSGFHSMQMSTVERYMMQELSKISSKLEHIVVRQNDQQQMMAKFASSQQQIMTKQVEMTNRMASLEERITDQCPKSTGSCASHVKPASAPTSPRGMHHTTSALPDRESGTHSPRHIRTSTFCAL